MEQITIWNRKIGFGKAVLIVAEVACGHQGSLERTKKMVKAAADSGADAIKFHSHTLDEYVVKGHAAYELVEKISMSEGWWEDIFAYARKLQLSIIAMPNDFSSTKMMHDLGADAFFVHSANLCDYRLLKQLGAYGKPVFLGIGASTEKEIEDAIGILNDGGNENIVLMHGYQAYPTKLEDNNLKMIPMLIERFGLQVGFLDHTDADSELAKIVPLMALPFGATILEKHITLDREKKPVDWQSALNPVEFKDFVFLVREMEKTFGVGEFHELSDDELGYRKLVKKSVVAARDIEAGEELKEEDFVFKRTKPGMSPSELSSFLGLRLKKKLNKDELLDPDMVD